MSSILVSTVFILITSSLTPSVLMNVLSWKLVIFSLAMGRTNTIITSEKITSFHDNTFINTEGVNDDVIKILVMIVLVRPIAVLLSTIGTEITKKERALVAMMAPRGIVVL
jgi:NhaP-type Na+/H+ or K+/H+ antiporter